MSGRPSGPSPAVLLIDDHPLIRAGLVALLLRVRPDCAVREASSFDGGLALAQAQQPDLVLLDLNLPDARGTDGIARFRAAFPTLRIVVLSGQADARTVDASRAAGAHGFIAKGLAPKALEAAIAAAIDGQPVERTPDAAALPAETRPPAPAVPAALAAVGLTARQRDVLRGLVHGLSNRDIAAQLDLSEATVKTHIAAVMRAVDATTRTQVIGWLARHGIALDRL